MRYPQWLDKAVLSALPSGDAETIARAIAADPVFLAAIKRGLANRPAPGVLGLSPAQVIANEVASVFTLPMSPAEE